MTNGEGFDPQFIPRVVRDGIVGPVDTARVPRFSGIATFALLPRIDEVEHADIAVLGAAFDSGVTYRPGARFGPAHVRESSRMLRAYHPGSNAYPFGVKQVVDAGDVPMNPFDIPEALTALERAADYYASKKVRLMTIGGDHTISLPLLRSVAKAHGPIAFVHFDAHLDTNDQYFGSRYTHGTPFKRASDEGLFDRSALFHVGTRASTYGHEDYETDESIGFTVISSDDVYERGPKAVAEEIREQVGGRPLYLSLDIDVLDPAFAPGTGTPEAGGLTSREILMLIRNLASLDLVGADVVEVAPAYDSGDITGVAASHVAYELITWMSQLTPHDTPTSASKLPFDSSSQL